MNLLGSQFPGMWIAAVHQHLLVWACLFALLWAEHNPFSSLDTEPSDRIPEARRLYTMPQSSVEFTEQWLAGPDGIQFYTRTYPATFPEAIILFLHGYVEHVGRYQEHHAEYPPHKITVFAFDLRGYGRTALDTSHKSRSSKYGQTNWQLQIADIEHFGKYLKNEYPDVPLYLMGQSAGAAQAIAYFTRESAPPAIESTKLFAGVICTSPLLTLTSPTPKLLQWIHSIVVIILPHMPFPATIDIDGLSRNPVANDEYIKDPLVKRYACLELLYDMLRGGEVLARNDWKRWPRDLSILLVHGTGDKITNFKTTERFYNNLDASDKQLYLYEGGYHVLAHDIDGIPERLVNDCVNWVKAHVTKQVTGSG